MHDAVDLLGQGAVDARHLGQLFDAGAFDAAQPAEVGEQLPSALRPHAGNFLQFGLLAFFLAPLTVSGDGETVCFITDVLQQVRPAGSTVDTNLVPVEASSYSSQ